MDDGLLDLYFAEAAGAVSEKEKTLLAHLMKASREGDLCIEGSLPDSIAEEGKSLFPKKSVVRFGNSLYLQKNWVYETHLIDHAQRLASRKIVAGSFELDEKLLPEQKQAVRHAVSHAFSVISGGPGTGKTFTTGHIIRAVLEAEKGKSVRIALAAPTGKAALHLHATLQSQGVPLEGAQVSTLHRLLSLQPGETKLFSGKRIDADLVIVDEASMIEVPLLAHLLEAIGDEARLVLLGDADQLPPVEGGSIFAECADLFGVRLQRCMRTEKSDIQAAAQAIQKGEDFFDRIAISLIGDDWVEKLAMKLKPIVSESEPEPAEAFRHYNRLKILNALRQGPFGADELNRQIFRKMEAACRPGEWWAVPILVTANLPRLDLYNGSSGLIIGRKGKSIQLESGTAYFAEKGRLSKIPPFELSFCLSIHKSQGSEFDEVIALFPQGSENFGREALYTAATRAKNGWEAMGEKEILRRMLSQRSRRMSGFTKRFNSLTLSQYRDQRQQNR